MLDIQEATRTGKSGREYKQFFVDGKLVGCDCDEARAVTVAKYHFKPCHHMAGRAPMVTPVVEQEPITVQEYPHSCELCGRRTRGLFPVCWICAGA